MQSFISDLDLISRSHMDILEKEFIFEWLLFNCHYSFQMLQATAP